MDKNVASPALSARQIRFALAYGQGYTAVEAAVVAGYAPASARANAHRLLKNNAVSALAQAEVQRLQLEQRQGTDYFLSCLADIMLDEGLPAAQRLKATAQYLAYLKLCARNRPALPPDVRQAIKAVSSESAEEIDTDADAVSEAQAVANTAMLQPGPEAGRPNTNPKTLAKTPGSFSRQLKKQMAAKQLATMAASSKPGKQPMAADPSLPLSA